MSIVTLIHGSEYARSFRKGFTLVELLVVVGIFAMMTGLILANYSGFDSSIILENTTYEIALEIRQAQSFGMGVREVSSSPDVFPAYGVRIPTLSGTPVREAFLFSDIPSTGFSVGNGMYDGGDACIPGSGECVEKLIMQKYHIYALCGNVKKNLGAGVVFRTTDDIVSSGASTYCDKESLEVLFTRPDPDAVSNGYIGGVKDTLSPYSDAEIVVASPRGDVRTVVIWSTGQITVE